MFFLDALDKLLSITEKSTKITLYLLAITVLGAMFVFVTGLMDEITAILHAIAY